MANQGTEAADRPEVDLLISKGGSSLVSFR